MSLSLCHAVTVSLCHCMSRGEHREMRTWDGISFLLFLTRGRKQASSSESLYRASVQSSVTVHVFHTWDYVTIHPWHCVSLCHCASASFVVAAPGEGALGGAPGPGTGLTSLTTCKHRWAPVPTRPLSFFFFLKGAVKQYSSMLQYRYHHLGQLSSKWFSAIVQ